jgi:pyruvate/2-oxoglutarate dehydrogenase complex dihydrolipoamide acyltransferase (E2) component
MADYSLVKDPQGNLRGVWVRDPAAAQDREKLATLLTKHNESPEAVVGGKYRVVPNTFNSNGGCFVMFGTSLAPGEKAPRPAQQAAPAARPPAAGKPPAAAAKPSQAAPPPAPAASEGSHPTPPPPPQSSRGHGAIGDRARQHARQKPREYSHIIFASLLALAGIGTVLAAILGNQPQDPTFRDLKQKLDIQANVEPVNYKLPKSDFEARLKKLKPLSVSSDAVYVYYEYRIDLGVAVITLDRKAWDEGEAVIKQMGVR